MLLQLLSSPSITSPVTALFFLYGASFGQTATLSYAGVVFYTVHSLREVSYLRIRHCVTLYPTYPTLAGVTRVRGAHFRVE